MANENESAESKTAARGTADLETAEEFRDYSAEDIERQQERFNAGNPSEGNTREVNRKFSWKTLHAGDCTMENAVMTLWQDGTAAFEATVYSTDTNDQWAGYFNFLDPGGAIYAGCGTGIVVFNMHQSLPTKYHWTIKRSQPNACRSEHFWQISRVRFTYSC